MSNTKRESQGDKRERELYGAAVTVLGHRAQAAKTTAADEGQAALVGIVFGKTTGEVCEDVRRWVLNVIALGSVEASS